MVQTAEHKVQITFLFANHDRFILHDIHRHIAKTDALLPAALSDDSLCDHAAGIGKVDQPCIRAQFLHILDNLGNHRCCAQQLEHTAGTIGLLTDHAMA